MKKFLFEFLFGNDKKMLFGLLGALFLSLVLGCSFLDKKVEAFPSEYHGVWESENQSVLRINANGKGDLNFKTNNVFSTMEGCLEYVPKEKTIYCSTKNSFGEKFKIDEAPKNGEMKLNGVIYYREEDLTKREKPSENELQKLIRRTILDINDGIQEEDFQDFHKTLSKRYKKKSTPDDVRRFFQVFIDKEFDFGGIRKMDADISESEVKIELGRHILNVKGSYETKPETIFDFFYIWEKDGWKLTDIEKFGT